MKGTPSTGVLSRAMKCTQSQLAGNAQAPRPLAACFSRADRICLGALMRSSRPAGLLLAMSGAA
jgi:hypothetical protein